MERLTVEDSASTLAITGYAANGDLIARIDLRTGNFYFAEFEREVEGRQLRVDVRGHVATHESAGHRALKLPLFTGADGNQINELLLDPRVRPLLSSWQIEINDTRPNPLLVPVERPSDSSTPYSSCSYVPTDACRGNGTYSCAESSRPEHSSNGDECIVAAEQDVCCASTTNGGNQQVAIRICGMGPNNGCGAEGPMGCAVCWSTGWTSFCTATTIGQIRPMCIDSAGNKSSFWTDQLSLSHD